MKKLLCTLLALMAFAVSASAQSYTALKRDTNTVLGGTSNLTETVRLSSSSQVSFQYSFKLTGAGTTGVLFSVDGSNDATNWQTGIASWVRSGNGTTAVTGLTNFNFGATPFVRVQIHNTNAAVATNWQFNAVVKPSI